MVILLKKQLWTRVPPTQHQKLVRTHLFAYFHTYGLDAVITRCSNNYGPYQFPEKLIPLMVNNILTDKDLPIYGKGDNVRDWIHVEDHCIGIWAAYVKGKAERFIIFVEKWELFNLDLVEKLLLIFRIQKVVLSLWRIV